ncbi:MAG: glycosyltransferase family 4 protein [Rhabdochlamydiaceae bacterium]|jgi:UDP-glucose:(heptosyl)LPS alpha-1,3-glucosyltransferase
MITLIKAELFKQGGLEKYTWQIARDFCTLGCEVTLLTSGIFQPPFSSPLLKIVTFPIDHPLSVLNLIHFDRSCSDYIEKHPTPIIFSLDRNRFQTHLRAGNGVHAAYLERRSAEEGFVKRLSFALNPLHRVTLSLEKKGFEHPDLKLLFTNSFLVKEEILQFYHTDPDKIQVVHNGVEWHGMQAPFDKWESEKEKTAREWHLDPNAFQFLFIGHNFRRKGLEKLLSALVRIKGEHFQLSVVGKEKNLSHFKAVVQSLGLSKKVFFFGPQKETSPFYQIADCLIIPSLYDPFANVTVEALAMGLYVISSKSNGGHEVLKEQSGTVIESLEDPLSFAEVLKNVLNRRKTVARACSIRQSVKHLDFSNQLRKITQLTVDSQAPTIKRIF